MEQMADMKEENFDALIEAMSGEGTSVKFSPDEVAKIGRSYLIACAKNEQEERLHRAKVMKETSRVIII
jgi:hypothetical protein